ncbi:MAG: type IV conjugative transfer system protein TraE [Deltaproteobacteria bacterium GWC2_56_8]|nr:MAG: type IV conjugative transfer system protein TraE [Deltaproteobacteria bacterium GWC2_56_8]
MKLQKYVESWENALRENRFYKLVILLLLAAIIANGYFRRDKAVVITPPEIKKEFWISPNRASDEYVEQMSLFFITFVSNISPDNVKYFHQVFSKYLTSDAYSRVKNTLAGEAEYIKKNNISQSFIPGTVTIGKNGVVLITGEQRRFIGNEEVKKGRVTYRLNVVFKNWTLNIDDYNIIEAGNKNDDNAGGSDGGSGAN